MQYMLHCCSYKETRPYKRNGRNICKISNKIQRHYLKNVCYICKSYVRYFMSCILTILMLRRHHSLTTSSIPWLLMPWFRESHLQPWYWLWRISRFWSSLRKNLNYLNNQKKGDSFQVFSAWQVIIVSGAIITWSNIANTLKRNINQSLNS